MTRGRDGLGPKCPVVFTAAGVVPSGDRKTSSRIVSWCRLFFWSFGFIILILKNSVLLSRCRGRGRDMACVAHFITGHGQPQ